MYPYFQNYELVNGDKIYRHLLQTVPLVRMLLINVGQGEEL